LPIVGLCTSREIRIRVSFGRGELSGPLEITRGDGSGPRSGCENRSTGVSDPAMEKALHDTHVYRQFAGIDVGASRLPDESTIMRLRHFHEEARVAKTTFAKVYELMRAKALLLKSGSAVYAALIAAFRRTRRDGRTRDPEMHRTKRGKQYHLGIGAHIGADADLGYRGIRGTERSSLVQGDSDAGWFLCWRPSSRAQS